MKIKETAEAISNDDWAIPGRPATETELEILLGQMDKETDTGITSGQFLEAVEKWGKI